MAHNITFFITGLAFGCAVLVTGCAQPKRSAIIQKQRGERLVMTFYMPSDPPRSWSFEYDRPGGEGACRWRFTIEQEVHREGRAACPASLGEIFTGFASAVSTYKTNRHHAMDLDTEVVVAYEGFENGAQVVRLAGPTLGALNDVIEQAPLLDQLYMETAKGLPKLYKPRYDSIEGEAFLKRRPPSRPEMNRPTR